MDVADIKAIERGFALASGAIKNASDAMRNLQGAAVSSGTWLKTFQDEYKKIAGRVRARKIALNILDDVTDKLLENGEICPSCELNGTFCEGSRCEAAKDAAWDDLDRQTRKDLIRSVIGNKYYNLSLTVKNELLCI